MIFDLENISKKELILMLQASELMIKESESRAKESESRAKESESKAKESESKVKEFESRAKEFESQVKKQEQIIEQNSQEVQWLKHQIAQLRRMLFGSKRERFEADASQTKIQFEEYANEQEKQDETPVKETITYEREKNTKKHNGRNQIPDSLPVLEHVIEPEEDTTGMRKIGEERTEILEYVPEKFFKLVIIRPKYARLEQNQDLSVNPLLKNVVIANLPSRPIEKCLAGNTLLAAILVNKYVDHLPLYRQQQIFKRADIEIAPSTMDSWVAQLGNLMELLYKKLIQEVKAQTYLQADETTTKVLDRTKKDKTHLGYYWTYHAPLAKLVAFDYQKGRDTNAPREFLQDYDGILQTDGYNVYKHYYSKENIIHLACWAHARRKFENALQSNPKLAEYALAEIQKLYIIEREAKELTPEQRKEVRLEKALPIINDFGKWLHDKRQQVLPKSPMGMAIEYVTPLWESLQNYLHDGNLMIDNNLIENTIRPIALGRKNYLFAGSHNGAKRSAMFYSFFACCKLNNINPHKWLEYVLENIADYKSNKLHELLPNNINPETILNFKKFYEV